MKIKSPGSHSSSPAPFTAQASGAAGGSGCRAVANAGLRAVLLWLLATGLTGCMADKSTFLHPYGPIAAAQRDLFIEVIGWMLIVVLPVFVLVPLFAWRYRRGNKTSHYAPRWGFSWPLEFAVWGIPVAVVGVLAYLIISKEVSLDPYAPLPADEPPLEIQVVGLDWKWLFVYPEQRIATVGLVAFPKGRPVRFRLTSDSVMQSFFIPSLGSQIFAMAGMVTELNLLADRVGEVHGENTQFSGMGFQEQTFTAAAMTPTDFATWIETVRSQGRPLDSAAYEVLSQKSTTEVARGALGMADLPPARLYFSQVGSDFFDEILARYRRSAPFAGVSGNSK